MRPIGKASREWWVLLVVGLQAVASAELIRFDFGPSPRELLLARTASGPMKTCAARRAEVPPEVDGKLDDAVWKDAALALDFSVDKPATEFRACYDDNALYIGVRCEDLPGRARKVEPAQRDGRVWNNSCIEIWVGARSEPPERYHFIIDAGGGIYDSRNGKAQYNPVWKHAVADTEGAWQVELGLPLASLGLERWPGRLKFNVGRHVAGYGRPVWSGSWGGAENGSLVLQGISWKGEAQKSAEAPAIRSTASVVVTGDGLAVECSRPYARPGDRYVEVALFVDPAEVPLTEVRLTGRLKPVRSDKVIAETVVTPKRSRGRAWVDLRAAEVEAATLDLTLHSGEKVLGAATLLLHAKPAVLPLQPGQEVPVHLSLPDGVTDAKDWPVVFGVPFPEGALWDPEAVQLVDREGRSIPHQKEVSGRWSPDGAIKWLRVSALADTGMGCALKASPAAAGSAPKNPVRVQEANGKIILTTGDVRYVLGTGISPIEEVQLGGRTVATSTGTRGLFVTDQKGRLGSASAEGETMVVESRGPVVGSVRFEGPYRDKAGAPMARHITRVECWAGRREARITHTLVLSNDTNEVWFKDIGWELAVPAAAQPSAVFAASRDDLADIARVPLAGGARSAIMLQDDHYYYAHNKNHFSIRRVEGENEREIKGGEECGDWAALTGTTHGLAFNCAEAARQHPKEFEVFPDRLVLHLFSGRSGTELDFRAPTLVKKWNLTDWLDKTLPKRFRYDQETEKTAKLHSNALGWSKTHELLVVPLGPAADTRAIGTLSRLQREPLYASADPEWVYRTQALGRLHPRDRKRFPEVEKMVDDLVDSFFRIRKEWGEYGFMDYPGFAPHAGGNLAGSRPKPKRNFVSYALPHGAWLLYARGGDRIVRDYAAGLTRMRNDSLVAHWGSPNKTRGYYINCGSDQSDGSAAMDLPFYWGVGSCYTFCPNVSMVNDLTWGWYLTGDRRMKDCLDQYVDALKKHWTIQETKRAWRITWNFGRLMHLYDYSWDPLIGAMADLTADAIHEPGGSVGITSNTRLKAYTTTYKIWIDLRDLIMAGRITGQDRFREMAERITDHVWGYRFLKQPAVYDSADGIIADFLHYEKGDTSVVESLRIKLEQLVAKYRRESTKPIHPYLAFYFEGIPLAQDILRQHDYGKRHTASWAACEDFGSEVAFCTRKPEKGSLSFRAWSSNDDGITDPYVVKAMNYASAVKSLTSVNLISSSAGWAGRKISIPSDAPATDLSMSPVSKGSHEVISNRPCPLVLHAPSYWKPSMIKEPAPRVYFRLPEGEKEGQIFFEGNTQLYAADGTLYSPEEGHSGWVDLPPDRPGLWSFESLQNRLVRVRNLPPFFAFERKENYFEPAIQWHREPVPPKPEPLPATALYVDGAIELKGNQALHLRGRRRLTLEGGEPLAGGSGRRFVPTREGTIEFFFQPNWGSFQNASYRRFLVMPTDNGKMMDFVFKFDPKTPHWFHTHAFQVYLPIVGRKGWIGLRTHRRVLIEPREWIHIALVWGYLRPDLSSSTPDKGGKLHALIFIDGKKGMSFYEATGRYGELSIDGMIQSLGLPGMMDGAVDELRISNTARYGRDFAPPSRKQEMERDKHTCALFHFNGTVEGLTGVPGAMPTVDLQE